MPYKDPAKQREFQRKYNAEKRAAFFAGRKCSDCGTEENLSIVSMRSCRKLGFSASRERLEQMAKENGILCARCTRYRNIKLRRDKATVHGHATGNGTPTYTSWSAMRTRCTNPNHDKYQYYGGSGVKVCDRWGSFENFLEDMGERPEGTTLDRIDPFGHYEPGNCRWATPAVQGANKRRRRKSAPDVSL